MDATKRRHISNNKNTALNGRTSERTLSFTQRFVIEISGVQGRDILADPYDWFSVLIVTDTFEKIIVLSNI